MTRKKTLTKDAALLEALRSNLHLLGEIAMRYEVETQPETPGGPALHQLPPGRLQAAGAGDVRQLAQEQLRVLLSGHQEQRRGPEGGLPGERIVGHRQARRGAAPRRDRGRPAASSSATTTPAARPDAQPGGRSHHEGAGAGGQAAGHRAARSRRHRRGDRAVSLKERGLMA